MSPPARLPRFASLANLVTSHLHLNLTAHRRGFLSPLHFHHRGIRTLTSVKSQLPGKDITSKMISAYWANLHAYYYEPGFFSYKPTSATEAVRDTAFLKRLLQEAIRPEESVRSVGEVAGEKGQGDLMPSVIAKSCCQLFEALDDDGKIEFFKVLGHDFGVSREASGLAANDYLNALQSDPTSRATLRTEHILRHILEPAHAKFFDRVRSLPGGIKFLISMRADLLSLRSHPAVQSDPYLTTLNDSLRDRLSSWLVGFLDLERVTWSSPAALLEKISEYEAVHAVADWNDLKRRVGLGRRVFGFFFRNMPHEPLVFVHVAFTKHISSSIAEILHEAPAEDAAAAQADAGASAGAAIFYSITTQKGLAGIDLGAFLIKRVVRDLSNEFPRLTTFCTLSPVPGFRRWILKGGDAVEAECERFPGGRAAFQKTLIDDNDEFREDWEDPLRRKDVQETLLALCSRYILREKRGNLALDPVANFHFRNGACAHRINYLADTSPKGLSESFGIMINYKYVLDHIEENNQRYLVSGTVAVSEGEKEREESNGAWFGRFVNGMTIVKIA